MDKEEETAFMQVFPMVLGVLIFITVIILVIARMIVPSQHELALTVDPRVSQLVESRIAPVGQVRTSLPEGGGASAQPVAMAAARSGEEVYNTACAACHTTGVMEAPKFRDAAAWEPRMGQGLDGLLASAIAGKNAMPPRGGNPTLSDEEIRAAIEHMLTQ